MSGVPVKVDLTDVDAFVRGEHHEMFRWLRANDPVHWHEPTDGQGTGGFWALTRYADVAAAYVDHATFLSSGGAMLGGSFRSEGDTAAGQMLVASDPPRHRMLRQQMRRSFTSEFLDRVAVRVAALVDEAIGRARRAGGCDFSTDIAPELPAGAIMATMAVGYDEAHRLIAMTRRMIGFRDPAYVDVTSHERIRLAGIQAEILEFFDDLLRERRRRPGSDAVSILAAARFNGRPLSDEEILYNCMNLAVGGNETTSHTASAGVLAFTTWPGMYRRLRSEPRLMDSAINEMLRWSATNAYVQRVAARDVEFGGRSIRRGDSVTLWNISANRDEAQFDDGDSFLVDRSPNRHLSYGNGIHRCIGAALGHVELSVLFNRLIQENVGIERSGPVRPTRSNFILGYSSLPVRFVG